MKHAKSKPTELGKEETTTCHYCGGNPAATICQHLLIVPVQAGIPDIPAKEHSIAIEGRLKCSSDHPKDIEWNKEIDNIISPKMICRQCYDAALESSFTDLTGDAMTTWDEFVGECVEELRNKHDKLEAEYAFSKLVGWAYERAGKQITFFKDGAPSLVAEYELIGSLSMTSKTWLWAWANPTNYPEVISRIKAVAVFGKDRGFPHLTVPKWPAEESRAWAVSAIAARILNAQAVFRAPYQDSDTDLQSFLAISGVRKVKPPTKSPVRKPSGKKT
jgi:hypothetical protein